MGGEGGEKRALTWYVVPQEACARVFEHEWRTWGSLGIAAIDRTPHTGMLLSSCRRVEVGGLLGSRAEYTATAYLGLWRLERAAGAGRDVDVGALLDGVRGVQALHGARRVGREAAGEVHGACHHQGGKGHACTDGCEGLVPRA